MALAKFFQTAKRHVVAGARAGLPAVAARTRREHAGLPAVAARRRCGEGGFSILEVLVATSVITVAVAALAQLFAVSTRANASAKTTTYASMLAQQKMEQLRGLTWGFDTLGLPMSDTATNTTVAPESPAGGTGLSPSPDGALGKNTDGYCDFLDRNGQWLAGGTTPPTGTAFVRRWSVEPLPTNPNNTIVLQVMVTRAGGRNEVDTSSTAPRMPDEARLVSVKTRKAS
jgi:type II secretory pathway pseudopilin PulG